MLIEKKGEPIGTNSPFPPSFSPRQSEFSNTQPWSLPVFRRGKRQLYECIQKTSRRRSVTPGVGMSNERDGRGLSDRQGKEGSLLCEPVQDFVGYRRLGTFTECRPGDL